MKRGLFTAVVVAICTCECLFAGLSNIRFRKMAIESGFPSKTVNVALQDTDGFMWFGAYDGLIKYDGYNYTVYKHEADNPTSLSSSYAKVLYQNLQGILWIGGVNGLSVYQSEYDNFKRYEDPFFEDNIIHSFVTDTAGTMWMGTEKGLLKYNRETDAFTQVLFDFPVSFLNVFEGKLCVGTRNEGVILVNTANEHIEHRINSDFHENYDSTDVTIFGVEDDGHGNLWLISYQGGLYKYNLHKDLLQKIQIPYTDELSAPVYFTLKYIDDQTIMIGCLNYGLIIYDAVHNTYANYQTGDNSDYSIVANSVRHIYEDRNHTIWISTHLGGVCYYNDKDLGLNYFAKRTGFSLNYSVVSSFSEDLSSRIWVGADGGGVNIYDVTQNKITGTITDRDGLESNSITGIERDAGDKMWVSLWNGSVSKIDATTHTIQTVVYDSSAINSPYSPNNFKGLFKDSQDRMWMFPLFSSIVMYDEHAGRLHTKKNTGGLPSSMFGMTKLIDAVEDIHGNVWFYGYDGVGRLDTSGHFTVFSAQMGNGFSLLSTSVSQSFADAKGDVWFSSTVGLVRYDSHAERVVTMPDTSRFPNEIFAMLEDDAGYLWITSSSGLGRFHPDSLAFVFFDKNIGISYEEYIAGSCYKARNGNMYFGSTNGFISFNPKDVVQNLTKPRVNITGFTLFGNPVVWDEPNSPLSKSIGSTDTVILLYRQNIIGLQFASTDYISPYENQYAYRLRGFTDEWTFTKRHNQVTYTNLDPGHYTFEVKAANNEGLWADTSTILTIIVLPPWWQTWWFRSGSLIFVCLMGFLLYRYRIYKLKMQNVFLAHAVTQKTIELQTKNEELKLSQEEIISQNEEIRAQNEELFDKNEEISSQKEKLIENNKILTDLNSTKDKLFSIIGHDLKNPISVLIGFSGLMLANKSLSEEKKTKYTEMIYSASNNVLSLLENLLDWARSQTNSIDLKMENLSLEYLATTATEILAEHANKKGISITIAISSDIVVYADEMTISTTIRNLVSNAIKYTAQDGSIHISAKAKDDSHIVLEIADTGVGMTPKKLDHLFDISVSSSTPGTDREHGTGLGLILCKEFVEKNNGKIWVESTVGKGSVFSVSLLLAK